MSFRPIDEFALPHVVRKKIDVAGIRFTINTEKKNCTDAKILPLTFLLYSLIIVEQGRIYP